MFNTKNFFWILIILMMSFCFTIYALLEVIVTFLYKYFESIFNKNTMQALFIIFVIGILLIVYVLNINLNFYSIVDNNSMGKLGAFGDFMGGILNPILMFLTLFALIITIVIQQKEFSLQRKEFVGQKEALEHQKDEMIKQTFDNKFFQMLNSFTNIVNTYKPNDFDKSNIFEDYKRECEILLSRHETIVDKEKVIRYLYIKLNTVPEYSYYFLNLYQILKYIYCDIPIKEEIHYKKYSNIIRAQLSQNELILIYFNSIGSLYESSDKFKILIEKYSLLEHISFDSLISDRNENSFFEMIIFLYDKYDKKAFGKNHNFIKRMEGVRDFLEENQIDI